MIATLVLFITLFNVPGVTIINDEYNWNRQIAIIDYANIRAVRLPITKGFGNTPAMVDDLVNAGVTTIVYQSRDCLIEYENVYYDLVSQAFQLKILEYPNVQFILEVGNEPDICGRDAIDYANSAHTTIGRLRPLFVHYPNLRFFLGLGVHPEYNRTLLSHDSVLTGFDGIAYHIYGHNQLWDAGTGWDYWDDGELYSYGLPIILTEVGINDDVHPIEKAHRYHTFSVYVEEHHPNTELTLFWTVTPHPYWPQYHITPSMATIIVDGTMRRWR